MRLNQLFNEGTNWHTDPEQQSMDATQRGRLEREREPAGSEEIDARIRADNNSRQQYAETGRFWLKQKDSQEHISDAFAGKAAANAAALELLKQQPELRGNIVITAYGPGEQQVTEGKVKELSQDLRDKTMSEEEFKRKYGKTRAEVRAAMREKSVAEGYQVVPDIDRERYTERPGLEGPFHTKSGKVVYYDKQEGKYYDPDSDFYISHEDWEAMNEQGVAEDTDKEGYHTRVRRGDFRPSKYGEDEYNYLHDLMNTSGDSSGPQLVTINDKKIARQIATMYGADVEDTGMGTYRIVQRRGDSPLGNKRPKLTGVAEGSNDTIYPNAEVIKSKNGKPVGEIYQDGNSWGAFHYRADRGYDFIDSREEAIEALKDLHQETGRSRPDYTIKGVAEGLDQHPGVPTSRDELYHHHLSAAKISKGRAKEHHLQQAEKYKPKQGVAEGFGDVVKGIKRASQGWGVGAAPDMVTPSGAVSAFKNMDGQRLANFVASRKDQSKPRKNSAGAFVDKVIDREMRQRGYGQVANKDDQGVAEGGYSGIDDTDTVGFSVNSERAYNAVMARFGDQIDHDETSGILYVPARMWPKVEMVAFDADGEGATQTDGLDEGEKVGNMDADRFDAAMARLKQLAGAGPMKTVYDPNKRVYRNVPTAQQPKK